MANSTAMRPKIFARPLSAYMRRKDAIQQVGSVRQVKHGDLALRVIRAPVDRSKNLCTFGVRTLDVHAAGAYIPYALLN